MVVNMRVSLDLHRYDVMGKISLLVFLSSSLIPHKQFLIAFRQFLLGGRVADLMSFLPLCLT